MSATVLWTSFSSRLADCAEETIKDWEAKNTGQEQCGSFTLLNAYLRKKDSIKFLLLTLLEIISTYHFMMQKVFISYEIICFVLLMKFMVYKKTV